MEEEEEEHKKINDKISSKEDEEHLTNTLYAFKYINIHRLYGLEGVRKEFKKEFHLLLDSDRYNEFIKTLISYSKLE